MISRTTLSNSKFLDDSFFSSVTGGDIGSAVGSVGSIVSTGQQQKGKREDMLSKTSCEKPKMLAGKKKKAEYEACLQQFIAQSQQRVGDSKAQREEKIKQYLREKLERDSKILGIPKVGFYVGLGVVVVVGGFLLYKKYKK